MNSKYWKLPLLLILPVAYIIIAGIFFVYWRPFYILCPDPVYSYLFTGMTIANGNLEIGYIDHPGITVQCFSAAVIYIQHFFMHSKLPVYQDVIMHPESYLYVLCTTFGILHALVTLVTGYYVYKKTGSLATALLFQITPLLGHEILSAASPTPESFMLICGMAFAAYIYCSFIAEKTNTPQKASLRNILLYGAFTGFLVATKYTCLPILFLVLIMLPNWKSRIKYIGSFALFFLLFISPAIPAWRSMFNWITSLATHTGKYGQGGEGIINKSEYLANFGHMFREDNYFATLYILLSTVLLIALIKRKQIIAENRIYLKLLCGVWVSSSLLMLLVAKHYSFHYLLPVRFCYPLIVAGSYGALKSILPTKLFKYKFLFPVAFYAFSIYLLWACLKPYIANPPQPYSTATADFLNNYSNIPLIITSEFGSSRPEPALEVGNAYTRNFHNKYWEYMKKLYPNTYRYMNPSDIIRHWDDVFYTPELFSEHPKIMVYFNDKDSLTRKTMLRNLCIWNNDTIAHDSLVYVQNESNEYVYELRGNQNMAKALLANPKEVRFDFEKWTANKSKFISTDGLYTINRANELTEKEYHSRTHSILLNKDNSCSGAYYIHAIPGNIIKVSIWCKSEENRSDIVLSTEKGGDFYVGGHAVLDSDKNGWKLLEYKCLVPPVIKDSTVKFFIFYFGHTHAYYDDLSIMVFPMKLNNSTFAGKD